MMRFIAKYPLRITIPIFLFVVGMIINVYSMQYSLRLADDEVEDAGMTFVMHNMSGLQASVGGFLQVGNEDGIKEVISTRGSIPNIDIVLMADEKNVVLYGTSVEFLGIPVHQAVPDSDADRINEAKKTMSGKVILSRNRESISAYFPVLIRAREHELRPSLAGILFMKYDLTYPKAVRRCAIERQAWQSVALYSFLFLSLGIILYYALTKRVMGLVVAAKRFEAGDSSARSGLQGKDELAQLGQAFDTMVKSITREQAERNQAEEQVKKQNLELEKKNAELERFTYTISHDLKSPIITIKGFLGTLVADARAGKIERMESDIKRIARAADKMQALLEDVLELSRIGRMVNPSVQFSMTEAAQEAIEGLDGVIRAKGVTVTIESEMPVVFADLHRIREVLQNLIENGVKYMGNQTEPRIEVGCRFLADGRQAYFVQDNGLGIDPKFRDKIFGLFEKLDPHSEGTGIGLALVKRIIELHNGTIWVESPGLGQGSVFYFTLPQHTAQKESV